MGEPTEEPVPLKLRVPPGLKERLVALAADDGRSLNGFLNRLLEDGVTNYENGRKRQAMIDNGLTPEAQARALRNQPTHFEVPPPKVGGGRRPGGGPTVVPGHEPLVPQAKRAPIRPIRDHRDSIAERQAGPPSPTGGYSVARTPEEAQAQLGEAIRRSASKHLPDCAFRSGDGECTCPAGNAVATQSDPGADFGYGPDGVDALVDPALPTDWVDFANAYLDGDTHRLRRRLAEEGVRPDDEFTMIPRSTLERVAADLLHAEVLGEPEPVHPGALVDHDLPDVPFDPEAHAFDDAAAHLPDDELGNTPTIPVRLYQHPGGWRWVATYGDGQEASGSVSSKRAAPNNAHAALAALFGHTDFELEVTDG